MGDGSFVTGRRFKQTRTFDADLELKDAGLVAASAAGEVNSVAQILDIGTGYWESDVIIDVSACEVDTGDELYQIGIQISSKSDFSSDIYEVATLKLGDASVLPGDVDMGAGRYVLKCTNAIAENVTKRYARVYTTVSGTIATGINYTAYMSTDNK